MIVENVIQIKSGKTINVAVSAKIQENVCEKIICRILVLILENGKYFRSIAGDSVIVRDEIIK